MIDSPVLPDELERCPRCSSRRASPRPAACSRPTPTGITCSGPSPSPRVARLRREHRPPARGRARRRPAGLRDFDEELCLERPRPLSLGSLQALPVPGRCELGARELELHPTDGHTADGMAIVIALGGCARRGRLPLADRDPAAEPGGGIEELPRDARTSRSLLGARRARRPGARQPISARRARAIGGGPLLARAAARARGARRCRRIARRATIRAIHERNVAVLELSALRASSARSRMRFASTTAARRDGERGAAAGERETDERAAFGHQPLHRRVPRRRARVDPREPRLRGSGRSRSRRAGCPARSARAFRHRRS